MDLLTVAIYLLVGYTVNMAEGSGCNSTIPHGRVNWYTCEDIHNGQKCMYSCDYGYQTHRLWSWLSCDNHTGRWTPYSSLVAFMYNFPKLDTEVLCSPRLCPNSIPNGILSENCEAAVGSPPCNYICNNGYVKTNQDSLTCLSTARWNRDLFSLCAAKDGRQCSWILPGADLDLSCDRRPGSTCTYRCHTPYHSLYYPSTILCQETDLMWSPKHVCSDSLCPAFVPNGWISSTCSRRVGGTCSINCNSGYTLTLPGMTTTCLSSGGWDVDLSNVCVFEDYLCPAFVANGWIPLNCRGRVGDICSINCNSGYTLTLPGMTTTCLSSGEWDVDLSNVCKNSLCPAFVPNGWISSTCSRRVGKTCSINCNSGYTLTLPGMTATCLSSGGWDVDLSNVCVFEDSLCPAFVANGWIPLNCSRRVGDICSINCNSGYTLTVLGMTTTCLSSGEWDVDLSNVCKMSTDSDSSSSDYEAPASSNIIIPLTLAVAAVTTLIVGIIIVCFRCQHRCNRNRSPHDEISSSSHISTMYSVGQCRMGSNLNLRSGSQTSFQAHDVSPPPYTEVMKNNRANLDPPPSYEEVNASPSSFLPDSYM